MWIVTCSGFRPRTCAAVAWSTVCICVPVQISQRSASIRTVQLSGSIGACARNGKSYSASTTFAAFGIAAAGSPAAFALTPGVFASARYSRAIASLSSVAPSPGFHSTVSASRPSFADQKWSATTATPDGTCTTWRTPGTASAFAGSNDFTVPPKYGERRTSAVCSPGKRTSMPNCARPLTLSGESRRFVGWPMTVQDDGGSSAIVAGRGSFDAASVSSANAARRSPARTAPFSTRHDEGGTPHFCAAASTNSVRASAPTWR